MVTTTDKPQGSPRTAEKPAWLPDHPVDDRTRLRLGLERLDALRDEMIAQLDALDGDADLEPSLGAPEPFQDYLEPVGPRLPNGSYAGGYLLRDGLDQTGWARGGDCDEREDVSEDEGGACEDEGAVFDAEPDECPMACDYAKLPDGTEDQTKPMSAWGGPLTW